ncbi:hypothetical protein I4U23_014939 [Adineta vaga]|nr:hypothetical protein I4U23_014939 [Adineta vaga]
MSWRKIVNRVKQNISQKRHQQHHSTEEYSTTNYVEKKPWLELKYHDSDKTLIKKPEDLQTEMLEPSGPINLELLDRIQGSMIGMTIGDALGACVEFRPREYLLEKPIHDLQGGGTWGLRKGQFTDDTSMALCLANSLVAERDFNLYNQLVRYKWWYKLGYMSSTGQCFDIGQATRESLDKFDHRQRTFAQQNHVDYKEMDSISDPKLLNAFDVYCSCPQVAGNGALMRLAPVPLFFSQYPEYAVEYSGRSGKITHGDIKAYDACRFYAALIVAALQGRSKDEILDGNFYSKYRSWFGTQELCPDIQRIADGSYKKPGGYDDGIRGKGYIVNALEAALWAFWADGNSFTDGACKAVNLGDDTDTTAAIYGQLAGAYYGFKKLPKKWVKEIYGKEFIFNLSRWITYEGVLWRPNNALSFQLLSKTRSGDFSTHEPHINIYPIQVEDSSPVVNLSEQFEAPIENKRIRQVSAHAISSLGSKKQPLKQLTQTTSQQSASEFEKNMPNVDQYQMAAAYHAVPLSRTKSNSNTTFSEPLVSHTQSRESKVHRNDRDLSQVQKTILMFSTDEYSAPVERNATQSLSNQPNEKAKSFVTNHRSIKNDPALERPPVSFKTTGHNVLLDYPTDEHIAATAQPSERRRRSKHHSKYASSTTSKSQIEDQSNIIYGFSTAEIIMEISKICHNKVFMATALTITLMCFLERQTRIRILPNNQQQQRDRILPILPIRLDITREKIKHEKV